MLKFEEGKVYTMLPVDNPLFIKFAEADGTVRPVGSVVMRDALKTDFDHVRSDLRLELEKGGTSGAEALGSS